MSLPKLALLILCLGACSGQVEGTPAPDAQATDPEPNREDAGKLTEVGPSGEGGAEGRKPVASEVPTNAVCKVGQVMPCSCAGGMPGTRTCLSVDGQQSACGCFTPSGPDVLVPPPIPQRYSCGGKQCDLYLEEETTVSARGCCTKEDRCGSSSSFIFGTACVERHLDPGTPSTKCPDETPNFLDLYGCCRPDGACGLSIDQVANFDVACIERSAISRLINDGGGERGFLSLIFFLPNPPADYKPMSCK